MSDFTDEGLWSLVYPQLGCLVAIGAGIIAGTCAVGMLIGRLLWG